MKTLLLSSVLLLGSFTVTTSQAKADDTILDGCALGALAGVTVAALTKGKLGKGALIGGGIGCVSDAAYNDDIEERKIQVRDSYGNVYYERRYVTDTSRSGGKYYINDGATITRRRNVRVIVESENVFPSDINLDN